MDGNLKKQSGHRERLKARFLNNADGSHSDEALLELLLTYALPQKDVQPLVKHLLTIFGSLEEVLSADLSVLTQQDGIKEHTAALLKAIDWIRLNRSSNKKNHAASAHSQLQTFPQTDSLEDTKQVEATATMEVEDHRLGRTLVTPPLFFGLPEVIDKPAKKQSPSMKASSMPVRSGLFSKTLLEETVTILPHLPDTDSADAVRVFLRQHLPFSGESTRERNAQYITRRMFPSGIVDRGLRLFARTYAGRQELSDVCFYRFCKAEPLMYDLIEQLLFPALGAGQIARSLVRDYLHQRFPGYASTKDCAQASVEALVDCRLATADRETLRFAYREPSIAAFAFVLHSEFPEPGMYAIAKMEQNRALRALLWQPAAFLPMLYELRNRQLISKISEIDALRQFTTLFTLDQLCESLAAGGSECV